MIGYTDRQALRVLHRIDSWLGLVEDTLTSLASAVEDTDESPNELQEQARALADRQAQVVERRLKERLPGRNGTPYMGTLTGILDALEQRAYPITHGGKR